MSKQPALLPKGCGLAIDSLPRTSIRTQRVRLQVGTRSPSRVVRCRHVGRPLAVCKLATRTSEQWACTRDKKKSSTEYLLVRLRSQVRLAPWIPHKHKHKSVLNNNVKEYGRQRSPVRTQSITPNATRFNLSSNTRSQDNVHCAPPIPPGHLSRRSIRTSRDEKAGPAGPRYARIQKQGLKLRGAASLRHQQLNHPPAAGTVLYIVYSPSLHRTYVHSQKTGHNGRTGYDD